MPPISIYFIIAIPYLVANLIVGVIAPAVGAVFWKSDFERNPHGSVIRVLVATACVVAMMVAMDQFLVLRQGHSFLAGATLFLITHVMAEISNAAFRPIQPKRIAAA